jgi:hypothetical protein
MNSLTSQTAYRLKHSCRGVNASLPLAHNYRAGVAGKPQFGRRGGNPHSEALARKPEVLARKPEVLARKELLACKPRPLAVQQWKFGSGSSIAPVGKLEMIA